MHPEISALNDFNQWSFLLRFRHSARWGAPLPQASLLRQSEAINGAVEGFVWLDDSNTGAQGVAVQLDQSRTTVTDEAGRYRFDEVPVGAHSIALNMADLPAEFSPGAVASISVPVKARGLARADLRVVEAGSAITGFVRGIADEDKGTVRLENVVINLTPGNYTSCDNNGEFAFYNLRPGSYRLSVDAGSLPENYMVVSDAEVTVDAGASEVVFRIEKRVPKLPVRRVFEAAQ